MVRGANDGPCAARVPGAVGQCVKMTFRPIMSEIPSTAPVGVKLVPLDSKFQPDWTQGLPVPPGANGISALVAGAVGGEAVGFTFGHGADSFAATQFPALTRSWQPINISLVGVTYNRIISPFGWSSTSPTAITFYFDNIQIK
jgi:hypothetical protein